MKRVFAICYLLFAVCATGAHAADQKLVSCGEGFLVVAKGKSSDGLSQYECQKLWCRDLENGKPMGVGDKANAGYKATSGPYPGVSDASGKQIACFGDRKWCAGETAGVWNPQFGAFTRGGADNNSYMSIQKGDCFAWQMQKPVCTGENESAIMQNGEWVCATADTAASNVRASAIRRTGAVRIK